ncbi:NTPase [anaerobic digester metagenome]
MTAQRQQKWVYAAALACLWASSEIILGSFLHNLKVPMRGTILASIAVIIMTAVGYRFRLKGIYWRAGLLTAAMKTLSPSAVLLGPMMAITIQGLLMEIVITTGGTRRIMFILGGAISITWNFAHLILGYWLYYGNDVVALGSSLVQYAQKETGWQFITGWGLIAAFGSIYFIAGAVSGFIGTSMKKPDSNRTLRVPKKEKQTSKQVKRHEADQQPRSLYWLFLLVAIVVSMLMILSYLPLEISIFAWLAIISLLIIRYRKSYRRLAKVGFWVVFLLLTVLSSLLLGPTIEEGLMIGLRMNLRAILFVLVLSALSFELRNEKLAKAFNMRNKGFLSVLETCFETLPMVISILPPAKSILKTPRESLSLFVSTINVWVDSMHFRQLEPVPAVIISGEKGSGKSRLLKNSIIPELERNRTNYAGILMQYLFENDEHIGYTISLLPGNTEMTLVGPEVSDAILSVGKYSFSRSAFEAGSKHIEQKMNDVDVVFLDESGWLETYGLGWYGILKEMRLSGKPMIVVVRPDLKEDFVKFWNIEEKALLKPESEIAQVRSAMEALQ